MLHFIDMLNRPFAAPIVIEFIPGLEIQKVPQARAAFRGVSRLAAHTDVASPDGCSRVQIPSDQIVFDDRAKSGALRIGLGGMSFEGLESEKLVFWRVRDVLPSEQIGSGSADKVLISTSLVSRLSVQGAQVWPVRR